MPGFAFSSPPPLSSQEFLDQCECHLDAASYSTVSLSSGAAFGQGKVTNEESPFLAAYIAWERSLRNELSRLRARRVQGNEDQYLRESEISSEGIRIAQAAFAMEDPLQAEFFLEKERWSAIESLAALSDFQLDGIIAYGLRLRIAERVQAIQAEAGKEQYALIYEEILGGKSNTTETAERREQ